MHVKIAITPAGEWDNNGTLPVAATTVFDITAADAAGSFVNNGLVYDSGTLTVDANLRQHGAAGNAQIDVINGGKLILDGAADGGCIGITAGTLAFARAPHYAQPRVGSYAAANFRSGLAFAGTDATVQFDGAGQLAVAYRPALSDLLVSSAGRQIADLHLIGGFNPYSAAEFTTHGRDLQFHFIRV